MSKTDSDTKEVIESITTLDDLIDVARAIGIEIHVIKNKRGRPSHDHPKPEVKPKKKVGRPKKEPAPEKEKAKRTKPNYMSEAELHKKKEKIFNHIALLAKNTIEFDEKTINPDKK